MSFVIPFVIGKSYSQPDIRKKLNLAFSGGIRPSITNNLIAVFMNAHDLKPISLEDKFGRANIYQDYYNNATGLYHYTGAGQTGDQTLSRTNLSLENAKECGRKIYFFHQSDVGSQHKYIGEVEVVKRGTARQKDRNGKDRKVIIFYLRPLNK